MRSDVLDLLRNRVFLALGSVTVAACGSTGTGDGDDGGHSTTNQSSGDGDGDGDDAPLLDIKPEDPTCEGELPPDTTTGTDEMPSPSCDADGAETEIHCVPIPPDGTSCESYDDPCVAEALSNQLGDCAGVHEICEHEGQIGDACCYEVVLVQTCPGRPFTVAGQARLCTLRRGEWGKIEDGPAIGALDPATRAALGRAYRQDGIHEHAAIASFARFTLELLSLGAPVELVAAAQTAMGDELRHATAFFALAQAYDGESLAPGPLDLRGGFDGIASPAAVARGVASEGAIAETISAHHVLVAAARAEDPCVRATLERIAAEELEHAELAWRTLAWMLETFGDEVRDAIADTFAEPSHHVPAHPSADDGDPVLVRDHGRPSDDERAHLTARCLERVVLPAARRLLGASAPAPRTVAHVV